MFLSCCLVCRFIWRINLSFLYSTHHATMVEMQRTMPPSFLNLSLVSCDLELCPLDPKVQFVMPLPSRTLVPTGIKINSLFLKYCVHGSGNRHKFTHPSNSKREETIHRLDMIKCMTFCHKDSTQYIQKQI